MSLNLTLTEEERWVALRLTDDDDDERSFLSCPASHANEKSIMERIVAI